MGHILNARINFIVVMLSTINNKTATDVRLNVIKLLLLLLFLYFTIYSIQISSIKIDSFVCSRSKYLDQNRQHQFVSSLTYWLNNIHTHICTLKSINLVKILVIRSKFWHLKVVYWHYRSKLLLLLFILALYIKV